MGVSSSSHHLDSISCDSEFLDSAISTINQPSHCPRLPTNAAFRAVLGQGLMVSSTIGFRILRPMQGQGSILR
jgi:hypothetical protein